MMLEYDIVEGPRGLEANTAEDGLYEPDPGIFLALPRPGREPLQPPSPDDLATTMAAAVGWDEDEVERRVIERVFAALPRTTVIGQIGVMPGRELREIRLVVSGVAADEIPDSLERVGWPGQIRRVLGDLNELGDAVFPSFALSLDVSSKGVGPCLGVELYAKRKDGSPGIWTNTGLSDWLPAVKRLEEGGWCLPEKGLGLLNLLGLHQLFNARGAFTLYRGINHVKLVFKGNSVSAKAYAGLKFHQRD